MLLFNNDDVLHHITSHSGLVSRHKPSGSISLKDMNSYISASLAGVLQPLGKKPKRIKGKPKERARRVMTDIMKDSKSEKFSYSGARPRKQDSISKKLSFSMDDPLGKEDFSFNWSAVTATPQRNSSASYLSDDYSVDTLSCVTDFDSGAEMARQPRSTASALLRYRGIVSPPSSKTRKSNMIDSCLSSQLSAGVSSGNEPWEMLRSVCAEPSKKFATVHHLAKLKVTWEALAQSLIHSIRRYDRQGSQFSTLCSLLIARGDHEGSFAEVSTKIEDKFRQSLGCVQWNPFPVDFWISV